jgi:hypothetical protein
MATVARLEAALARAKELELQERLELQEKIDQDPQH